MLPPEEREALAKAAKAPAPPEPILVAKGEKPLYLLPRMANRHGLVAGATGTGKTVTLHALAHEFSRIGVPVFVADVKGDLAGISRAGSPKNTRVTSRYQELGLGEPKWEDCPVAFWDVFGEMGHPLRATISEMGPILLSRLMGLNETQSGVLSLAFRVADDNGLLLLDMKDLRAILQLVADNAKELTTTYGNVSAASVGAIQRSLLALEEQGATKFFGEPSLALDDIMRTDALGRGYVNILAADKLIHQAPKVYAAFLLWLLSELFQNLPEVGDPEKPKLVFFFDEAHLLFNDVPKALLDKIEQVVRLIRSKAVGVYFVTQSPMDVPEIVLGQLGNRVQHALRAFTPRDQKAVKAAAGTFRANPKLDTEAAITELGIGEALVSFLDEKGMPGVVERGLIVPPTSQIGPIEDSERARMMKESPLGASYDTPLDRESAYELLQRKAEDAEDAIEARKAADQLAKQAEFLEKERAKREAQLEKERAKREAQFQKELEKTQKKRKDSVDDVVTTFAKTAARSVGSNLGRSLTRGILGGLLGMGTTGGRKTTPRKR